jgi:hypothetical protein
MTAWGLFIASLPPKGRCTIDGQPFSDSKKLTMKPDARRQWTILFHAGFPETPIRVGAVLRAGRLFLQAAEARTGGGARLRHECKAGQAFAALSRSPFSTFGLNQRRF